MSKKNEPAAPVDDSDVVAGPDTTSNTTPEPDANGRQVTPAQPAEGEDPVPGEDDPTSWKSAPVPNNGDPYADHR